MTNAAKTGKFNMKNVLLIAALSALSLIGASADDKEVPRVYKGYGKRRHILKPAAGQHVVIATLTQKKSKTIEAHASHNFAVAKGEMLEISFPITDPKDKAIDEIREVKANVGNTVLYGDITLHGGKYGTRWRKKATVALADLAELPFTSSFAYDKETGISIHGYPAYAKKDGTVVVLNLYVGKDLDQIRTYLKKSSPKVHAALEERLAILKKRAAEK